MTEPLVEAQLEVIARDDGYFVVWDCMGKREEFGPLADQDHAVLVYNWIMDKAREGGAIELTSPATELPQ